MPCPSTCIDLEETKLAWESARARTKHRIILCGGTGCIANGAMQVRDVLLSALKDQDIDADVVLRDEKPQPHTYISKSGCQGFCQMGPLVFIEPQGILYVKVQSADAQEIVTATIRGGKTIERLLWKNPVDGKRHLGPEQIPFYKRQERLVLAGCRIEPDSLGEYVAMQGYEAAKKVWTTMTPEDVCKTIEESGLRGRGGGGFPTGRKWALTTKQPGQKKYVICNGDEGDPGAFMDRSVMEGNPHAVIEGMLIAGRAIGADEGYVYVRAEYPLAVERMRRAVDDAMKAGILGENIFETHFRFTITVMEGAGAFVCGEETALIASIEGQRGMPRPKPPFPAESGLWGKPTVINNVETLATVPAIIRQGAAWFRTMGTPKSPGTKTFALTGHVANTGLIEVPFGTTLRTIVNDIGGGVMKADGSIDAEGFKSVQIGGPSGGCLTPEMLDVPLDFDSLQGLGAMVGSGGLVVMNRQTCMVQIARYFMTFTQNESCGKCVPCREGTRQMLALLDDIVEGRADENTLDLLEKTAKVVRMSSLCGLGKTAPNPVLSTLRHFRAEYEAHVKDKRCPTGQCKALVKPEIDPALCKGCTACAKKCPVQAITGSAKKLHVIDPDKCIKCGVCHEVCKFHAVLGF